MRSGYLRYFRFGSGPWPIVDRAGTQVGQVARQSLGFGGRTAGVWDMQNALWLLVKQSLKGTLLLAGDTEVGRVGWHGVGAMSTVNISMQLGGRPRARMLAKARNLRDGTARVVDPAGTDLLSVQLEEERRGRVFTLTRLVGTPDDYEYLVQGLIPALILELDSRTAFETTGDDPNTW